MSGSSSTSEVEERGEIAVLHQRVIGDHLRRIGRGERRDLVGKCRLATREQRRDHLDTDPIGRQRLCMRAAEQHAVALRDRAAHADEPAPNPGKPPLTPPADPPNVTTLMNGILLPSPEPDRNAVPLDLFPTTLLSTMTVVKSYSPHLPGQFGGGTLSIDTSSFPTSFEFRLGVSSSVSTGKDGLTNADARGFRRFLGFDDGSRAFPKQIPKNRAVRDMDPGETERIGESLPNVWTPEGETVTPNLGLTAMVGNTTKIGGKRVGYLASGMIRHSFSQRSGHNAGVALSTRG